MICPKCGFEQSGGIECASCGVLFKKASIRPARPDAGVAAAVPVRRAFTAQEIRILASGLIAAAVIYALPFTRIVFSALVTLFHELGHAVAGWLLGHPSLPAFDFVYGGGFTHMSNFRVSIVIAVAAAVGYAGWLLREHRRITIAIVVFAAAWLIFVTAEWRRELAIASAGHIFEFILAGILFYQALSGRGWRMPEVERPLGAFAAFFVQIHSMLFARRLMIDPDFLAWYREGKGGALMNDLEVVALDLHIYTPFNPGIEGVARLLLIFSLLPIAAAIAWHLHEQRS